MNMLSFLSEGSGANVIDRIQSFTATAEKSIAQQQVADPDYWSSVGIITITGIMVVFLILAILIFFFWLMGVIFKSIDKSKQEKAEAQKAAVPEKTAPAAPAPAPAAEAEENDEELVAVISAAIAAFSDGESFTIKSIRKHGSKHARSAWSAAGVMENTRPF